MKLTLLEGRRSAVTQADLENIMNLDAQIGRLQTTRDRIAHAILERLAAGAEVEAGPRVLDVEETYSGGRRIQQVKIS